jgi:hypothetical protein
MDEFQINTSAGNQVQPAVAGFVGTQFVVVWEDNATGDIRGRIFGVNGNPSDNEFRVNFPGQPGTRRQLPAIVTYQLGFAVVWNERAPTPGALSQLKLRTFDQDTLSGPEIQVSSAEVEQVVRPAMARLNDGGFVVVWTDKRETERIRAQRFAIDGTKNGAEFRANTLPGLHRVPMVAALTNGNIVIGWRARLAGPLLVHFQIFNATGPVGSEQTTQLEITEAAMTALDSGRFVIAHLRSPFDGEVLDTWVPSASVFEASGAFANIQFPVTSAQRIQSSWPTLAPSSNGRFLVGWTELNVDNLPAGINVKATIMSAQGAIGQVTQFNTSAGNQRFSLSAAITSGPDGDTAFAAWNDDADPSARTLRGRPLRVPAGGF